MNLAAAVGLGLALAVDASVVAFSCGLTSREHSWRCPFKLALVTGAFQGLMPVLGFFAAGSVVHYVNTWAHWIAFGVFLILGITFIRNAWLEPRTDPCKGCMRCALRSWKNIFAIGIGTSLDALAVGTGLACSDVSENAASASLGGKIFLLAAVIAGTTFVCVLAAFHATRIFRKLPVRLLGTLAGLILIALGIHAVL